MTYRLIVTRPDGSQTHSSADALPSREGTGMDALRVLAAQNIGFGREGLVFGRQVRDAAIGETVMHEPSGYSFRTEEF